MKDLLPGMKTALRRSLFHHAICWRVERTDGTILTFTSHDRPLPIDDEGSPNTTRTYQPNNAFSTSALENKVNLSVSNINTFSLTSDDITERDLIGGRYDKAVVEFFAVDWLTLANGKIPLLKGFIGEVELGDLGFSAELRDISQVIQQQLLKVLSLECRADLFDTQCKVQQTPPLWAAALVIDARIPKDAQSPLDTSSPTAAANTVRPTVENGFYFEALGGVGSGGSPIQGAGITGGVEPTWPTVEGGTVVDNGITWTAIVARQLDGTITTFHDRRHFEDVTKNQAEDYWKYGLVTWLSGANVDFTMEVRDFKAGGFTLWEAMPEPLSNGDSYRVQSGCSKRFDEDCVVKYANGHNFDGEPFIPGQDSLSAYPNIK